MKEFFEHWNGLLSAIVGIIVSLSFLFPVVRKYAFKALWAIGIMLKGPFRLEGLASDVKSIRSDVADIKHDTNFNGNSSMKDMVALLVNARKHDMRGIPRPILELDGHGNAMFANDAAFRLFRALDFENLKNGSWLRFLDGDDVRDFLDAYKDCAKRSDYFRFGIRVIAKGENRGMWEFNASPIDSGKGTGRVYSVDIAPVDKEAIAIATRAGWIGCPKCQAEVAD